jgi:hypothetical protein
MGRGNPVTLSHLQICLDVNDWVFYLTAVNSTRLFLAWIIVVIYRDYLIKIRFVKDCVSVQLDQIIVFSDNIIHEKSAEGLTQIG